MLHRMIREPWMYWKGRDRGLIWHPVPTFTRRAYGEPRKTTRITELRSRIWIRDLPNMKEDWQSLDLEFRPLCLRWELWFFGSLPRAFLLLFDLRCKRIFLYLKETNWAEAVSVSLRDVNWDVVVWCCCGINAIHQQFFYTKDGGYWIIILNIKVEEMQFLFTGTTILSGWKHGSCIFQY
jgi:hypothetical protein